MDEITILRHDAGNHGEYRAEIAPGKSVGRLTWRGRGTARVVDHTVVPSAYREHGIAAKLVAALVADARAEGFQIDPVCSYVAAQFRRHPEWRDLLA